MLLENVEANFETIQQGRYPLYRPLYITYSSTNPRRKEIKQFLKLAHSDRGREIIRNQGVVPYLEASKLVMKQAERWQLKPYSGGNKN